MINLLPPDRKENVLYARRNTKLIGWVIGLVFSLGLIAVIVFFGGLFIDRSIEQNSKQVAAARERLDETEVQETKARVEEISSSIKLATQVLGKQVLFSKLLQQIGSAMPGNSILTGLSINQLEGGIDLRAVATDYNAATQVQLNLSDPENKIFTSADIVSISCTGDTDEKYGCDVVVRAEFSKDNNPFMLINSRAAE